MYCLQPQAEAGSSETDPNVSPATEVSSTTTSSVSSSVIESHTTQSAVHLGRLLLQKMGWKEGEGLGKDNSGPTAPLILDMKKDRKGARDVYSISLWVKICHYNNDGSVCVL